jgi:hypothetical protein
LYRFYRAGALLSRFAIFFVIQITFPGEGQISSAAREDFHRVLAVLISFFSKGNERVHRLDIGPSRRINIARIPSLRRQAVFSAAKKIKESDVEDSEYAKSSRHDPRGNFAEPRRDCRHAAAT